MVFPFDVSVYLESTPSDHDTDEENNESALDYGEPSPLSLVAERRFCRPPSIVRCPAAPGSRLTRRPDCNEVATAVSPSIPLPETFFALNTKLATRRE